MNKYIVINSEDIQKRIEELEIHKLTLNEYDDMERFNITNCEINLLKQILSKSKPLTPIIEDAFDESRRQHSWAGDHIYGIGEYGQEEEDLTNFKYVTKHELLRNNEVYHIRTKWIETSDNRHSKYTYQDMYLPSGDNWYGLKFPRDSDFK